MRVGSGALSRPLAVAAAGALIVLAACEPADNGGGSDGPADGPDGVEEEGPAGAPGAPDALVATLSPEPETAVLAGETATERALATSQALFDSAPVVVVASPGEQLRAASAGTVLGVPVLVDGEGVAAEVERLGAEVALAVGPVHDPGVDVVVPADDDALAELLGIDAGAVVVDAHDATARLAELDPAAPQLLVTAPDDSGSGTDADPGGGSDARSDRDGDTDSATATADDASTTAAPAATPLESDRDALPATARPEPSGVTVALTTGDEEDLAALGTARAAGAHVVHAPGGDPRSTGESVQALAGLAPDAALGRGPEFGDAETLTWQVRTAATGQELPGGGQLALPGKTYVALYGTPSTSALGILGEQPIEETVTRAQELAAAYEPLTEQPVIPTLEIIATVASGPPGPDGNYSNELPVEELRPLVDLAGEHGLYVVLDLQPGRTDFVTQAKMYQELLERPYVGLALDPEWRLRPDQEHLTQIGQVDVSEVNEVVTWLADLTRDNDLPQKVLVLHQFQARMIPDVNDVDRSRPEVAVLVHADGQGGQGDKQATWRALHAHAPDIEHWGWKNFHDEDIPGPLSPEETMSLVDPVPDFISYQ